MKRLFDYSQSEPESDDMASEIYWMHSQDRAYYLWLAFWIFCVFLLCLFASCQEPAWSYTIDQAVRCVVGEAADQGYRGMLGVSEVIRHRGSLNGLYGCKAAHVASEPSWVWKAARMAYIASAKTNITLGADHFANITDFNAPIWSSSCRVTTEIKDHIFFKC